jgi:NAD(P)-dependent dehydrogenase (short-subunit alcohol dehydrogenase family)
MKGIDIFHTQYVIPPLIFPMSTATRNPTVYWCEPIHHSVSADGPLDPTKTKLHSPFIVVIIGSSRGIGRATALAYARAGASTIVLTGRTEETLSVAVSDVRDAAIHPDVDVRGITGDVCSDTALKALADELTQCFGHIDALVINAGVATQPLVRPNGTEDWPQDVGELDLADFRKTFDVNFFGVVTTMKYLLPLLEAAGAKGALGGWKSPQSVIVITSSSIHHYDPKLMAMGYSLSKFAAARMSEYVHEGHKEKGVCAFAIQPGSVMTGMFNRA